MSERLVDHRDLKVWQQSIDIVCRLYDLTKSYPPAEQFGLVSQMRRAAVSIPSNIAEGAARASTRERGLPAARQDSWAATHLHMNFL